MLRPVARAAAGLLVVPYLSLASALAPAHAHEPDADHSHAVVHSHFESHHAGSEGADVDHDAARVVWLGDSTIIHQALYQFDPPPALVAAGLDAIPVAPFWSVKTFDDGAPAHGPPRLASSLRGPPSFSA